MRGQVACDVDFSGVPPSWPRTSPIHTASRGRSLWSHSKDGAIYQHLFTPPGPHRSSSVLVSLLSRSCSPTCMSSIVDQLTGLPIAAWAGLVIAAVLLVHLVPLITDPYGLRSYPGPFLAKISDAWLGWVAAQGHRSEVVHELHQKHGKSSHSPSFLSQGGASRVPSAPSCDRPRTSSHSALGSVFVSILAWGMHLPHALPVQSGPCGAP